MESVSVAVNVVNYDMQKIKVVLCYYVYSEHVLLSEYDKIHF